MLDYPEKTVMTFVVDNERILLLKRQNTWFEDQKFCPPGGLVDEGETPEESAVRELEEETGIISEINSLNLIHHYQSESNDRKFDNYIFATSSFTGKASLKEPSRHAEIVWADIKNLPADTSLYVIDNIDKLSL